MLSPAEGLTALVADPSRFGGRVARDLLLGAGFRCAREVRDGAEAVQALAERPADLLVISWELDVIDAREVIAMMRSAPGQAPAILVTMAAPVASSVRAAVALGVGSIVAAPFSAREFRDRALRSVRERRVARTAETA